MLANWMYEIKPKTLNFYKFQFLFHFQAFPNSIDLSQTKTGNARSGIKLNYSKSSQVKILMEDLKKTLRNKKMIFDEGSKNRV